MCPTDLKAVHVLPRVKIKLKTLSVPKHHFIETYNGVEAQAQAVLTSILD